MKPLIYKFVGGLTAAGSLAYYPLYKLNTEFYYQKTEENQQILNLCNLYLTKYIPSLHLLPHGSFQSLWNVYGAKDRHLPLVYERDIITMTDGGTISVDWAYPNDESPQSATNQLDTSTNMTKVCFIFPGLSGSSDKGYVKSLVSHLSQDKGYIVGVFHNRGVDQEYTSPAFADLTSSEEIEKALSFMVDKFKGRPNPHFVGVGMSMGANLMLKVAGEMKEDFPLEAMVSFNNPFDLWMAINLMRNTPYEKFLARELRKNIVIRENQSEKEKEIFKQMSAKYSINFEELRHTESWKEFDEKLTIKVHTQFNTVPQYYHASSCLSKIKEIKKPTLVIHSRDDPIIPLDCLPIEECTANENIIVGIVRKGGHVCYFQGAKGQRRWYPLVSGEYLDAVLKLRDKSHMTQEEQLATENLAI